MGFAPGKGVGFGKVLVGGLAALGLTVGLATGLGIEGSKSAVLDRKIGELKEELDTSRKIASEININPPGGKGFINVR